MGKSGMKSGPTKASKTGSTAKTVMAPSKSKSVGAPVKKATGAKTVKATSTHNTAQGSKMLRPGMTTANATSAKTVKPYVTMAQQARNDKAAADAKARRGKVITPGEGFYMRQQRQRNTPKKI